MALNTEIELIHRAIDRLDGEYSTPEALRTGERNRAIRDFLSDGVAMMEKGIRFGFIEKHCVEVARAISE